MEIRPIKTEEDHEAALSEIETLLDAEPNTPECDKLEVLATLVLEFYLESRGLTRKDLEIYIGTRARVCEILNRKRPLTLPMIRRLAAGTGIPGSILIQPYKTAQGSMIIEIAA
ncbi:MAG: transcriptional regulator [Proteobacteria bacterium]|nr:transcriptional regulator [Pseudomonadota bacterium]